MKSTIISVSLITISLLSISATMAADGKSQPNMQNQVEQPALQQPSLIKQPSQTTKKKADTSNQQQRIKNTGTPPQNIPIQRPATQPLPNVSPGVSSQDMQQSQSRDLPQVNQTFMDTMRDSIHIRVSSVGPYGGSTVGGDSSPLLIGSDKFIVLVEHGPLSMTGVVPGEATGYDYYLYVHPRSAGPPRGCSVNARTGQLSPAPGRPDIQNDGRVRVLGSGLNRSIRDVQVPIDATRVLNYYLMLCVVGTRGEPRQYVAAHSNVAQIAVLGASSQR